MRASLVVSDKKFGALPEDEQQRIAGRFTQYSSVMAEKNFNNIQKVFRGRDVQRGTVEWATRLRQPYGQTKKSD